MSMRFKGSARAFADQAREIAQFEDRAKTNLDAALAACTEDMRESVHIVSGRLAASGDWSSTTDRDGDWTGEISFGGALAPHAVYELNRKGHGIDQVFARHEPAFTEAIRRALET